MTNGQNASPKDTHDLSEALKHLRFVHFTLVIGATALFITQSLETSTRTERAHDDSKAILRITQSWERFSPASLALHRLRRSNPTYNFDAVVGQYAIPTDSLGPLNSSDNDVESRLRPCLVLELYSDQVFQLSRYHDGKPAWKSRSYKWTLADFRRIWDEIEAEFDLSVILEINETATVTINRNGDVVTAQAVMTGPLELDVEVMDYCLDGWAYARLSRKYKWKNEATSTHYLIAKLPDDKLGTAVHATIHVSAVLEDRINLQEEIIAAIDTTWRTGSFSDTFRDIDSVSQNLGSISLDDLEKHLYALRQQEGERLTLVGLEIPANVIHRYGPIFLLAVQCYFVLHYRKFASLLSMCDQARNFPWIGVYDDRPSRIVFIITVTVLPAVVSTYVMWTGISSEDWLLQRLLLIACAGSQIVVSIVTYLIVRHTWTIPVAARNTDADGT